MIYKFCKAILNPEENVKLHFKAQLSAITEGFTSPTTLANTEPDLGIIYGLISDDSVDTEGDVLLTPGINTADWEALGAPYLFFHPEAREDTNNAVGEAGNEEDYMGHSLGTWRDDHMLWAALWHDLSKPKSKEVYEKYKNGEWEQFSIGFNEVKGQISTKASYCSRFGECCKRVIAKCTLSEVSAVPGKLAVNQNTTTLAVKADIGEVVQIAPVVPTPEVVVPIPEVAPVPEVAPTAKAVISYVPKKTIYYKSTIQDMRKKGRIFMSE